MPVRLKSRTQCPVGGFQFYQAETGFNLATACPTGQWDFNVAVDCILQHRLANRRFNLGTDRAQIAEELDTTNALRMVTIKNAESYYVSDASQSNFSPKLRALRSQRPVAAGGGDLPKLVTGAETLAHWMKDGAPPVPKDQAEARAKTCSSCKHNLKDNWLYEWFTGPISEGIRTMMNIYRDLGLATSNDPKLEGCDICRCPLKLKVHVPISYVRADLKPATKEDLEANAPWCWMVTEKTNA